MDRISQAKFHLIKNARISLFSRKLSSSIRSKSSYPHSIRITNMNVTTETLRSPPDGPTDLATNESAPAHNSRTTCHTIAWKSWNDTTILTSTQSKTQLDLTEHAAIHTRQPPLNRTYSAPYEPMQQTLESHPT